MIVTVCGWELRRLLASRSTLLLAGGTIAVFMGLVAFKHQWLMPINDSQHIGVWLYGSSALGQTYEMTAVVITFFGLLVPFLSADGVARDLRQRTHELVLTTAVPGWALVAGRFLAVLAQTLVAAALALAAVFATEQLVHAADPGFPAPDARSLLALGSVLLIPASVLLAGVSFLGGTLAPRLTTIVKIVVVLAWIALDALVDFSSSLAWYPYWAPGGNVLLGEARQAFVNAYLATGSSDALHAQQAALDLTPLVLPHLGLAVIGLAAGVAAAAGFRRFRGLV